jgi:hypothetical protein
MFTGCLATLAQRLEAAGLNPRLGRINDFIYSLNGDPTVFLDITSGSNGILPDGSTSTAHAGWDFVTGWGAPDFDGLYNAILATNQNSNVAIDATAITPLLGNFIGGDLSSIALSDDQYYAIGSVPDPTLGQAAGAQVDFNLPSTTTAAKISVEATGGGTGGATMMCYAFNWSTSQYELVGSVALPASGDNPKTIKIATEKLSSYVDGSNNMRLYVRCHIPKRPFSNGYPPPFAMDLDQLQLLTTQSQ